MMAGVARQTYSQVVQEEEPAALEKVPAEQAVQIGAREPLKNPASQAVQLMAPGALKNPGEQIEQEE